jgi:hypothetical protein
MRARIWKDGTWRWQVRKPGLTQSGRAPSWTSALTAALRAMGQARAA